MSVFSWNGFPFESFSCYNPTLVTQVNQNLWFQKHSSLASALGEQDLGEQKNQEAFSHSPPMFLCELEVYRGYDIAPSPSDSSDDTIGGHLNQSTLEVPDREVAPQSDPKLNASGHTFENRCTHHGNGCDCGSGCGYEDDSGYSSDSNISNENCDGNDNHNDLWAVANLQRMPHFCRVGECPYWNTELKQVKRHRDTHIRARYGWLCPNQTGTCPSFGKDFRRRDAVRVHCRKFRACRETLKVNGGKIECWGTPANDGDLVPYDPGYHIPYRMYDGRIRRRHTW